MRHRPKRLSRKEELQLLILQQMRDDSGTIFREVIKRKQKQAPLKKDETRWIRGTFTGK